MKKVYSVWAILLALCVGFSSCSKDDDDKGVDENVLIGKWVNIDDDNISFEFKKDGTLIHTRWNGARLTGTYTVTKADKEYGTAFTLETDYNENYIGLSIVYQKNPERLSIAGLTGDFNSVLLGSFKKQ